MPCRPPECQSARRPQSAGPHGESRTRSRWCCAKRPTFERESGSPAYARLERSGRAESRSSAHAQPARTMRRYRQAGALREANAQRCPCLARWEFPSRSPAARSDGRASPRRPHRPRPAASPERQRDGSRARHSRRRANGRAWPRLSVRAGAQFVSSGSACVAVPIAPTVYAGAHVCSHNRQTERMSSFSGCRLGGSGASNRGRGGVFHGARRARPAPR